MSSRKWGERIPQVVEVENKDRLVHRWRVYSKMIAGRGVCNCPAIMNDPLRNSYPQRWEDVPAKGYIPSERLKALDADGIDARRFCSRTTRRLFIIWRLRIRIGNRPGLQRLHGGVETAAATGLCLGDGSVAERN